MIATGRVHAKSNRCAALAEIPFSGVPPGNGHTSVFIVCWFPQVHLPLSCPFKLLNWTRSAKFFTEFIEMNVGSVMLSDYASFHSKTAAQLFQLVSLEEEKTQRYPRQQRLTANYGRKQLSKASAAAALVYSRHSCGRWFYQGISQLCV